MTKEEKEKIVIDLYVNQEKTQREISNILGYKTYWTVYDILKRNNISTKKETKFKKAQIELILKDHATKLYTVSQLAEKYNVFKSTIRRLLKLNNVKERYRPDVKRKLDDKTVELLINDYKTGKYPIDELGLKYGVDRITIFKYFKIFNMTYKRPKKRRYFFNENFFDIMDSQEKYWLLGWMYSDGNIHNTTMSIGVHSQDKDVLYKITKLLSFNEEQSNQKIKQKLKNFTQIKFDSRHMTNKLLELGCFPNKSKTILFPNFINDDNFLWAFLRGVFEGDGTFSKRKNDRNGNPSKDHYTGSSCALASGSKIFLDDLSKILKEKLNIDTSTRYHSYTFPSGSFAQGYNMAIMGGTKQILKFLIKLYESSTHETRLNRKYNNYLEIKRRYEAKYPPENLLESVINTNN